MKYWERFADWFREILVDGATAAEELLGVKKPSDGEEFGDE